jgi:2,3-bisphosphoglycerate-dependent phosphoglycerate mutase
MTMKIAFLRHGESLWNREGKFTGWTDVTLSQYYLGDPEAIRKATSSVAAQALTTTDTKG